MLIFNGGQLCFEGALQVSFTPPSPQSLQNRPAVLWYTFVICSVHLDTKRFGFNSRPSNRFHQRKVRKDAVSPLLPLVVLFWWVSVFSSVLSVSCYKLEWHQIQPLEINVSYLTCLVLDIPWHLSLLLLTVRPYVGMCTCECRHPRSPEEGVRCPGAGVSGGYELPYFKEQ